MRIDGVRNVWHFVCYCFDYRITIVMATARTTYTTEQRVAIVRTYYSKGGGYEATVKSYKTQFDKHATITGRTVKV